MNTQSITNENAMSDLLSSVDPADIKELLPEMFMTYIQRPEYRELDQEKCNQHVNTYSRLMEFFNRFE